MIKTDAFHLVLALFGAFCMGMGLGMYFVNQINKR